MKAKAKERVTKKKGHSHDKKVKLQGAGKKRAGAKSKKPIGNSKKPVKNNQSTGKRQSKWVKGQSGNPKGRPKGTKNKFSICDLMESIGLVEEKRKKSFLVAWIECSWGDPTAMSVVANFILPKLKSIEQLTISIDSAEVKKKSLAIREILRERCKMESNKETPPGLKQ